MTFSIIQKSQLENAKRMDAEYYQPEFLGMMEKIKNFNISKIGEVANVFRGNTPKGYGDFKIPIIRSGNLSYSFISNNLLKAKSENIFFLKEEDVLISSIGFGSIGKVNIFTENENKFGTVAEVSIIRNSRINPFYIWAFLSGKYGQFQINREITGATGQLHLNTGNVEKIIIPLIKRKLANEIESIYKKAEKSYKLSKQLYQQAEDLLLEELDLKNFEVDENLSSIVNLSEIKTAKRMDAEYFQEKYKKLVGKIESYKNGWDYVKNQFKQNKTLSKKNKEFYNYIEISDVNISNSEITPTKIKSKNIPANGKIKLHKNDLLISKVRPYRGAVSFIDFEKENLLGSGAFTVLQEKTEYKKEVLMIFLKTIFIKELLLRYNCGTTYPVIKNENILSLKIPLIKSQTQKQIADKIQESHKLRKESKEFLEEAKRRVEKEIEKN